MMLRCLSQRTEVTLVDRLTTVVPTVIPPTSSPTVVVSKVVVQFRFGTHHFRRESRAFSAPPPPVPQTAPEVVREFKEAKLKETVQGSLPGHHTHVQHTQALDNPPPPLKMKCPMCPGTPPRTYVSHEALAAHVQGKHKDVMDPSGTAREWISEHQQRMLALQAPAKVKPTCQDCGQSFVTNFTLEAHRLQQHGIPRPVKPKPLPIDEQCELLRGVTLVEEEPPTKVKAGPTTRLEVIQHNTEAAARRAAASAHPFAPPPPPPPPKPVGQNAVKPQRPQQSVPKRVPASSSSSALPVPKAKAPVKVDPEVLAKAPWWCNGCQRGFTGVQALLGHLTGRHSAHVAVVRCPTCRREYGNAFMLRDHIELAHRHIDIESLDIGAHPQDCLYCGRQFAFIEDLNTHVSQYHPEHSVKEIPSATPQSEPNGEGSSDGRKNSEDEIHPDDISFA